MHFFDPGRSSGIDWPEASSRLYRPTLIPDFVAAMAPHNPAGCIVVETSRRPEDDQWLLDLAASESLICGAVLNLQPDTSGFEERLARASEVDKFVGIRLRPIESYDLSSSSMQRSFGLLERAGKTIEFGAKNSDKKMQFAELAQRYPDTTWILDHCGHPPRGVEPDADWRAGIARIANTTNAVAKVSGLDGKVDDWRATLDVLLDLFGADRLMYGSNWPVCTLADNYENQIACLREYFDGESEKFFYSNAKRIYGLNF